MQTPFTVRAGRPGDLEAVLALDEQLFRHDARFDPTLDLGATRSEENVMLFLERLAGCGGGLWIAESPRGTLLGYLTGTLAEAEPDRTVKRVGEIEGLFVAPDARRHGVARKLVEAFAAWCRAHGAARLSARLPAGNAAGLDFYRRLGFADHTVSLEITWPQ